MKLPKERHDRGFDLARSRGEDDVEEDAEPDLVGRMLRREEPLVGAGDSGIGAGTVPPKSLPGLS